MQKGFIKGVVFGLLAGAGIATAGFLSPNVFDPISAAKDNAELDKAVEEVMQVARRGLSLANSAPQVSQVANETTVVLEYAQVKQNAIIIKKLDELIQATKR